MGAADKSSGPGGAFAIYSMATSSHADAPRGMQSLYSLNRVSVATSRAMCLSSSTCCASPAAKGMLSHPGSVLCSQSQRCLGLPGLGPEYQHNIHPRTERGSPVDSHSMY
jgi:hypothetical protein